MDMPEDFDSTLLMNWAEEGNGSGGKSFTSSSLSSSKAIDVSGDAAISASHTAPAPLLTNDAASFSLFSPMFSAKNNDGPKNANASTTGPGLESSQSLLHISHHPLAMTSMAGCPPYPATTTTGNGSTGNSNAQQQQQQKQQLFSAASSQTQQQQQQQQDATASSCPIMFINNYINNYHNQNQNSNNNSNNNNFLASAVSAANDGINRNNVNNAGNGGNLNNNNINTNFAITPTGFNLSSGNNNIINYNENSSSSITGGPHIGSTLAAAVVAANTASASSHQATAQLANHLHELRSNFQDSYATMPPPSMSLPMQMQMLLQQQVQQQNQRQQQHHYGITVNGFHPQVNAQTNHVDLPLPPLLLPTATTAPTTAAVHFRGLDGTSTIPSSNNYQFHPAMAAPGGNANYSIVGSGSNCGINATVPVKNMVSRETGFPKEDSSSSTQNAFPVLNNNNPVATHRGVNMRDNNINNNNSSSSSSSRPTGSTTAMSVAATSTDQSNTALHSRNSRDRNEREQVRAKKITQLITELRDNMQGGGWREEMKSKYQVLSQCRDYMEHLKRAHRAKEADIEHTKKQYEEQQRRQKEQAMALMNNSPEKDPVSETSSASGSTEVCTSTELSELNEVEEESSSSSDSTSNVDGQQNHRKRKKETQRVAGKHHDVDDAPEQLVESLPNEERCKSHLARGGGEHRTEQGHGRGIKRMLGEDNMSSTDTSSISEEDNEDNLGGKDVTFHKDSSTLSDMTDSNQSGTDGGSGGGANSSFKGGEGTISTSSISSTAAVVLGLESSHNMEPMRRHRRVRSKHNPRKKTSNSTEVGSANPSKSHKKKRRGFHYDYREVFLKSNVPQLIATLSGRIVVWNEFFLRATGLSEREAKRLTIFSIVQPNELSNLYKMVARALAEKCDTSTSTSADVTSGNSSATEEWQAITLKCIPFPNDLVPSKTSLNINSPHAARGPHALSITVALMKDVNRDQRCFHCILTDSPGSNGRLGSVTPELFAKLFNPTRVKV